MNKNCSKEVMIVTLSLRMQKCHFSHHLCVISQCNASTRINLRKEISCVMISFKHQYCLHVYCKSDIKGVHITGYLQDYIIRFHYQIDVLHHYRTNHGFLSFNDIPQNKLIILGPSLIGNNRTMCNIKGTLPDCIIESFNLFFYLIGGELCQSEYFTPSCEENEVIVMQKALYGRMSINR